MKLFLSMLFILLVAWFADGVSNPKSPTFEQTINYKKTVCKNNSRTKCNQAKLYILCRWSNPLSSVCSNINLTLIARGIS